MKPMRKTRRFEGAAVMKKISRGAGRAIYCFFTRILPLKDCSSIEEEPAWEVPAKERPGLRTNVLCSLAVSGKSFWTVPETDCALRSTDAVSGRVTLITRSEERRVGKECRSR